MPFRQTYASISSMFIEPKVNLKDCINFFCKKDTLDHDNMYKCEKCNKLRKGERYYSLRKMPNVLIFHLKRFRHFGGDVMGYGDSGIKIGKFIEFDEFYYFNNEKFQLSSVLMHHGSSSHYGHYTSYVRSSSSDTWFHCDDRYVEQVAKQDVFSAQAYVLFYRKIQPNEPGYEDQNILEKINFRQNYTRNRNISVSFVAGGDAGGDSNFLLQKRRKRLDSSMCYNPTGSDNLKWLSEIIFNLKSSNNKCFISQLRAEKRNLGCGCQFWTLAQSNFSSQKPGFF